MLHSDPLTESTNYPLFVVTTGGADEPSGCLAGFVTQSSLRPVRFLVCISKINHTFGRAEQGSALALHLLGFEQQDMASLFGELTGDVANKFAGVRWSTGVTGAPLLAECAAWVEGDIINQMSAGDHEAFLINVKGGGAGTRPGRLMLRDLPDLDPGHPAS